MRKRIKCGHTKLNETCAECAELLHHWNSRLEDQGLGEIEQTPERHRLNEQNANTEYQATRSEYYDRINSSFITEKFENRVHKFIMGEVRKGQKIVKIIESLAKRGQSIHRETVRYVIRRYEHKWGIRQWTPKQMHIKTPTKSLTFRVRKRSGDIAA